MRALLTSIAVTSMLLSVSFPTPAPASDSLATPSAAGIEKLLRDMLAKDDFEKLPSLNPYTNPYKNTMLMDFELVSLDQVSSSRWHAEIELLLDFGPPPPYILGFERVRRGRYHLVLKQQGERLGLSRFAPVARVQPLPASGR